MDELFHLLINLNSIHFYSLLLTIGKRTKSTLFSIIMYTSATSKASKASPLQKLKSILHDAKTQRLKDPTHSDQQMAMKSVTFLIGSETSPAATQDSDQATDISSAGTDTATTQDTTEDIELSSSPPTEQVEVEAKDMDDDHTNE